MIHQSKKIAGQERNLLLSCFFISVNRLLNPFNSSSFAAVPEFDLRA